MDKLRDYEIAFKGLKEGQHEFNYEIDRSFFELIDHSLIENGTLKAKVLLTTQPTMLTLDFNIKGTILTSCDRCLEPLEVPVKYRGKMYVKFGDNYDEPTDEIMVIPHEEHQINVAHLIYEFIGVSIPMQCVHPADKDGNPSCNPEMIAKLEEHRGGESPSETEEIDPRWSELKKLIGKNK